MYLKKYENDVVLYVLLMLLVLDPAGIAQSATFSSQGQQSSADETTQSQLTSPGSSALTLSAPEFAKKTLDSTIRSSLKGHIRKFQQYQTIPEGAFTQQQSPTQQIPQNAAAPDYFGEAGQPQFQTQNGYLQKQIPYPDQYAPYAAPTPGFYDPNQYQRYVQPPPSSVNRNRFPRAIPRFFGGCF
jgi:hypothetical protein